MTLYKKLEELYNNCDELRKNSISMAYTNATIKNKKIDEEKVKSLKTEITNDVYLKTMNMEKQIFRSYEKNSVLKDAILRKKTISQSLEDILRLNDALNGKIAKIDKTNYYEKIIQISQIVNIAENKILQAKESEIEELKKQAKYIDEKIHKYYR